MKQNMAQGLTLFACVAALLVLASQYSPGKFLSEAVVALAIGGLVLLLCFVAWFIQGSLQLRRVNGSWTKRMSWSRKGAMMLKCVPANRCRYGRAFFGPGRVAFLVLLGLQLAALAGPTPPYPSSRAIIEITWHWDTYTNAALGSDLWPVTWGPDDHLYAAWGDGGGFGGSDSDGRVSMGFARIEGSPEHFHGFNVNGGKNPEYSASFPKKGKTGGLLFDQGILYAMVNLQDGAWPDVNHVLAWSTNKGATWAKADWLFPKGSGNFQPARFVNFGKNGDGVPAPHAGYIYLYGAKQPAQDRESDALYLARAPREKIRERDAFEFFSGQDSLDHATWNCQFALAHPIFTDTNGVAPAGMVYNPALGRFLLTTYHTGPGQLGVFEARSPWGPWSTIAYYEDWGRMAQTGEGLTCEFPQKWMSPDGSALWAIFSVYGGSAKQGVNAHDRFNLIKATLSRAAGQKTAPAH